MIKNLTCITCPIGCNLEVELDGDKVVSVSGNTCKRGESYAISEFTNPVRNISSTMVTDKGLVAVKTDRPIPKGKIFECMEAINKAKVKTPVKIGDILIKDVCGCNIVAAANAE